MRDWRRKFAVWMPVSNQLLRNAAFDEGTVMRAEMGRRLDSTLRAEMAEWLEGASFTVIDQHSDALMRGQTIMLAETRALALRIPNPFPAFDDFLFPRLTRWLRVLGLRAA